MVTKWNRYGYQMDTKYIFERGESKCETQI